MPLLGLLFFPTAVWAQANEGEVEVDPSVEVGLDWNSNLYNQETDVSAGMSFRIRPELALDLKGESIDLSFWAGYQLRKFFNPELTNLDNFQDVDVGANLDLLPDSVVGFKSNNKVAIENRNTELTSADSSLLTHINAGTKDAVAIHPGRALSTEIGGSVWVDSYSGPLDASTTGNPRINSKVTYGPHLDAKWAFLPRTAVVLNSRVNWINWQENLIDTDGNKDPSRENPGDVLAVPDGLEWAVQTGIQGRFTNQLVLNLLAGYGSIIYDENSVLESENASGSQNELDASTFGADLKGLDGLLAVVELSWSPTDVHNLTLGYNKSFNDSWFTNYVAYNSVFGRYGMLIASRVGVNLEGGYRLENYVGEVTRTDHVLRGKADISYNTTDWMDAGLRFQWNRRASGDATPLSEIEYDTFIVGAQATFVY